MTEVRMQRAGNAEFVAYIGHEPSPAWRQWLKDWAGYIVERDGVAIGVGCVSQDDQGLLWAWIDLREKLPAILIHRGAVRVLASLRHAGYGAVHCYRNEAMPGTERWLRRLGFRPAPEMTAPGKMMVWKCDLNFSGLVEPARAGSKNAG